jgi:hypothetical protein
VALTPAQVRERLETTLSDESLEALITATYEAIAGVLGPAGPITELLTADAGDVLLLSRPAIAEGITVLEQGVELDDEDYALKTSHLLIRLSTGPNPSRRWRGRPEITYSVLGDDAERDRIALALIGLDLTYKPGITSIKLGDFSEAYGQGARSYPDERAAIFASYFAEQGGFI